MYARSRGYLPHFKVPSGTYFVTFRLCDSLPKSVLLRFQQELALQKKLKPRDEVFLVHEYQTKIERYLDQSYGACWLRDPKIAGIVLSALRKYNTDWYELHVYTVMPNHVHVLFSSKDIQSLDEILQNWKGASGFYANKALNRTGHFWQREYCDKWIRSRRQFEFYVRYIFRNPVKAGFCKEVHEWPWTGSSPEIQDFVKRYWW